MLLPHTDVVTIIELVLICSKGFRKNYIIIACKLRGFHHLCHRKLRLIFYDIYTHTMSVYDCVCVCNCILVLFVKLWCAIKYYLSIYINTNMCLAEWEAALSGLYTCTSVLASAATLRGPARRLPPSNKPARRIPFPKLRNN